MYTMPGDGQRQPCTTAFGQSSSRRTDGRWCFREDPKEAVSDSEGWKGESGEQLVETHAYRLS